MFINNVYDALNYEINCIHYLLSPIIENNCVFSRYLASRGILTYDTRLVTFLLVLNRTARMTTKQDRELQQYTTACLNNNQIHVTINLLPSRESKKETICVSQYNIITLCQIFIIQEK